MKKRSTSIIRPTQNIKWSGELSRNCGSVVSALDFQSLIQSSIPSLVSLPFTLLSACACHLKKISLHIFPDPTNFLIYFLLGTTPLPAVAWASAGTVATNKLKLKPAGSLASVMVTGCRVTVNEFCVSLNHKTIEPCWSPSLTT